MYKIPAVLVVYLILLTIPGLFGMAPNSIMFILYQIVCFSMLLSYVLYSVIRHRAQVGLSRSGMRFVGVYVGFMLVSAVYTAYIALQEGDAFIGMAQFFLPLMLASVFMIGFSGVSVRVESVNGFLKAVLLLLVFASLYNIVINFYGILEIASITGSYQTDFKGFFFNRNVFGYMMAIGIACSIYLWSKHRQWLYIIAMLILGISLFVAMSRGSFVFLGIFLIVFVLGKSASKIRTGVLTVAFILPVMLLILGQSYVQDNIVRSENSDTGRSQLREFGLNYYLQNNLLLGSGQSSIGAIEKELSHTSYHNLYIEALVTQGLVGLFIIVLGIVYSYSQIRIVSRLDSYLGWFFKSILCAYVVYILVESLPLFYGTPNSIITTYLLILLPLFIANSTRIRKGE